MHAFSLARPNLQCFAAQHSSGYRSLSLAPALVPFRKRNGISGRSADLQTAVRKVTSRPAGTACLRPTQMIKFDRWVPTNLTSPHPSLPRSSHSTQNSWQLAIIRHNAGPATCTSRLRRAQQTTAETAVGAADSWQEFDRWHGHTGTELCPCSQLHLVTSQLRRPLHGARAGLQETAACSLRQPAMSVRWQTTNQEWKLLPKP